jgi:hypothetical protein
MIYKRLPEDGTYDTILQQRLILPQNAEQSSLKLGLRPERRVYWHLRPRRLNRQ